MGRNTRQKEVIARVVMDACDHPTADTVLERARAEMPSLSLGTVYRVLKDMARRGEIREVVCKDAPSRFDKTTANHAHFTCVKCGKIKDVFFDLDKFGKSVVDFDKDVVLESQLIFRGICADCKEN
ncbi:MAG: Fur family transcriptional regulator [Christensenellales bacterium]